MPDMPWYAQPSKQFGYGTVKVNQPGNVDWTGYTEKLGALNQKQGFKMGSSISDFLGGLKNSPLWQQLSASGFNPEQLLAGNPAYQKLLAAGNQSFDDYYNQIEGKIDANYASPLKHYQKVLDSSNPSGAPITSTELLAAQGMQPIEAGARDLGQMLLSGGMAGGNRSGIGSLASTLPGQMIAGEGGRVRTQASLGNVQESRQREALNSQLKMEAAAGQSGIAGHKGQMLAGGLQGFTAAQLSAFQTALQALMQVLQLKASMMPQLGIAGSPGNWQMNLNTPLSGMAA